ncbi:MAG TPA: hypothetical protein VGQ58_10015 [Candidatus Limnocylindrales bacterium]|jgi:hypothetical protein|nr:hypothetical protein [Candidatus Limnocylindrales bacterium]
MSATDRQPPRQPRKPHEIESDDPGAFVGRLPERSTETIPGGIGPKDERVSASATQVSGGEGRVDEPSGHREGDQATDDDIREAGENR